MTKGKPFSLQARKLPPGVVWAPFKSWWLYQYVLPVLTCLKGVFSRLSQVIVLGDMLSCTVSQPRSREQVAPNCCLPLVLNCWTLEFHGGLYRHCSEPVKSGGKCVAVGDCGGVFTSAAPRPGEGTQHFLVLVLGICRSLLHEMGITLNLEGTAAFTFWISFAWLLCGEPKDFLD